MEYVASLIINSDRNNCYTKYIENTQKYFETCKFFVRYKTQILNETQHQQKLSL